MEAGESGGDGGAELRAAGWVGLKVGSEIGVDVLGRYCFVQAEMSIHSSVTMVLKHATQSCLYSAARIAKSQFTKAVVRECMTCPPFITPTST